MSAKNVLKNFEIIDTEEKAYWLGFLYADGSIGSTEDKIELGLAATDLHHIEKFRDFMGIKNKISYRAGTKSYRMSFRSQKCKQDLIKQGCMPKKSLIIQYPTLEQVPQNLNRHFMRGFFDGDGWFTNTSSLFQAGWMGPKDFIIESLNRLDIDVNKNNKLSPNHNSEITMRYTLNSLHDVKVFLDYIYQDSQVYLDRKYEHYIDFITYGSKYHKSINLPDIKEI